MTSESSQFEIADWARAKEIFADALDLPIEARAAFIEGACDSAAMLRAVGALVRSFDGAEEFLMDGGPDDRAKDVVRGDADPR